MFVVGYKPWLTRCIGVVLVTLLLVVVAEHGARSLSRAERVPHVSIPAEPAAFDLVALADVRLPNPARGPTPPPPMPRAVSLPVGSAAVLPSGDEDEQRWTALLRGAYSD